ncbi:hypothetical protein Tco_0523891 [Tanacetum coccineum]
MCKANKLLKVHAGTPPTSGRMNNTGTSFNPTLEGLRVLVAKKKDSQKIGLQGIFDLSDHVVRLGINPMIQPEPEDLPKDNPKLEIAVLRVILFSIHNDEWKSFQCHHQTALRSNGAFKIMQKYEQSWDSKNTRSRQMAKNDNTMNQKGSKSRSQSMKEQDYNKDKDQEHSSLNDKSNLTDLMKECHQ